MKKLIILAVAIIGVAYLVGTLVTLKMERDNLARTVRNFQQITAKSMNLANERQKTGQHEKPQSSLTQPIMVRDFLL